MASGNEEVSVFKTDDELYGKSPTIEPTPEKQIGIDTNDSFYWDIISSAISSTLDMSSLDSFLTTARSRDQVFALIDDMSEDSTIASVLETYAEDSTETNENGDIMWADSADADIAGYINYLLKSMRVNKNIYGWVHSLCKYGDLYLRLYRESEYDKDDLFDDESNCKTRLNEDVHLSDKNIDPDLNKEKLDESVKIKAYSKDDHYVHYLEMVPNPAEMFELTKFGKTYAYIKSEVNSPVVGRKDWYQGSEFMRYRFNKNDIKVYQATEFVHGYLEDNTDRVPEEVSITFNKDDSDSDVHTSTYKVRRGQSLLYNIFKIWRELQLLENSIMLNRVTKSAIVRIFGVEVGDMPKENVGPHLQGIKSLIEQKSALDTGKHMNEYTNPGPIENNVYIPKHNGVGAIDMQTVGGDVNVGQLTDLEYFRDKLFGALRVPKQFFGFVSDNAGFSGGQSLSIISARYAKMIVRIQNTIIQAVTDAVNLMLLDKDLSGYINKFTIKMRRPVTQDDVDRKDNLTGNLQVIRDTMDLIDNVVENSTVKLEILKSMLSSFMSNQDVIDILQNEINKITAEETDGTNAETKIDNDSVEDILSNDNTEPQSNNSSLANELGLGEPTQENDETAQVQQEENALPTPNELGLDFTNSNQSEFEL